MNKPNPTQAQAREDAKAFLDLVAAIRAVPSDKKASFLKLAVETAIEDDYIVKEAARQIGQIPDDRLTAYLEARRA